MTYEIISGPIDDIHLYLKLSCTQQMCQRIHPSSLWMSHGMGRSSSETKQTFLSRIAVTVLCVLKEKPFNRQGKHLVPTGKPEKQWEEQKKEQALGQVMINLVNEYLNKWVLNKTKQVKCKVITFREFTNLPIFFVRQMIRSGSFQDLITFALLFFIYITILVDTKQWASLFHFYPYMLLLFASYHFLKNLICVNLYNSSR